MPTYEYVCKKCEDSLEVFQSFSDRPLKRHKGCGGDLQKVFHARGIVFKGGGFYATDSRSSASKPSEKSSDKAAAKSGKESAKASVSASSDKD